MKSLYLLKCGNYHKIGIAENVVKRIRQLQTGNPQEITLVASYSSKDAELHEAILHRLLRGSRAVGEWFKFSEKEINLIKETYAAFNRNDMAYLNSITNEWKEMSKRINGGL